MLLFLKILISIDIQVHNGSEFIIFSIAYIDKKDSYFSNAKLSFYLQSFWELKYVFHTFKPIFHIQYGETSLDVY